MCRDLLHGSISDCLLPFIDEEELMASRFKEAMSRLAVVGHNPADLIDCSAVVPKPVPALRKPAT